MNTPSRNFVVHHDGTRPGLVRSDANAEDYARAQLTASLERAAFRVCNAVSQQAIRANAFDQRTVLGVLVDAIVCCVYGAPAVDFAPYAWTPEAPSILSALRHELLCGRTRNSWRDADLLPVVTAIEQLLHALEGDVALRFATQFSGAEGKQHLVELAHDMRSPLNAILLLVDRLQHGHNGPVTGAQQRHLALVYSAAFGLSSMANDLMDMARGGARLLGEAPKVFSVSDVLRGVRDVVQPLAEERRVALRFSSPRDDVRFGQVSAIHRVLLNLTTNALKFTTVGSVTVLVQQDADPEVLEFVVEDTGRGIPEPEMAEIFAPISGAGSRAPDKFSADGLGLAICQKLVSAMLGELKAESRVDHGTRVSFKLRLVEREKSDG